MPTALRTLEELCKPGAAPGYILDTGVIIENSSIADATGIVVKNIKERMWTIETLSRRKIRKFYIGKSNARKRQNRVFNPEDKNTWKTGVTSRYSYHVKEPYGKNGLIVVAVVTRDSIPEEYFTNGTIANQEEYVLTLEKRLIQKYKKGSDKRLANKGTDPGHTDEAGSVAYVVYMAFTLEGKCPPQSMELLRYTVAGCNY